MKTRNLAALAWLALASPALASQGSGCLPTTGTVSGLSMTQYINQALAALISGNSGASPPATDCTAVPIKGQTWLDTSVTPNVERRYDGNSWVAVGAIDSANHVWSPPVGGGLTTVAAATTTDICAAPSAVQTITGTTAITSFGSACAAGVSKKLIFGSATPLTYNATSLILPGKRSYTTDPGDMAEVVYLGAGNWRVASIAKIDGSSVTNPAIPLGTIIYGMYGTVPAKTLYAAGTPVSRSSYPDYLAAVTRTQNATMGAGNNSLSGLASTAGFGAGMPVEGTGIQVGTVISAVTSGTSMTISPPALMNGTNSVTVFVTGYGYGGDSTTVGLPECRGRVLAGRDDVISVQGVLTAAYFGADPKRIAAVGGSQSRALTAAEIPSHTHNGGGTTSGVAAHSHRTLNSGLVGVSVSQPLNPDNVPVTDVDYGGDFSYGLKSNNGPANVGSSSLAGGDAGRAYSFTTDGGTGGGQAHAIVQPTSIAECVVVVLP